MVQQAMEIATKAHAGQIDKAGSPYIEHPRFVAGLVEGDTAKAVAWLHDVVEDTAVTLEDLSQEFPPEVVEAVSLLTHGKNVAYEDYIRAIGQNPVARAVKLADLTHNSMIERIPDPSPNDYARLDKYRKAKEILQNM